MSPRSSFIQNLIFFLFSINMRKIEWNNIFSLKYSNKQYNDKFTLFRFILLNFIPFNFILLYFDIFSIEKDNPINLNIYHVKVMGKL